MKSMKRKLLSLLLAMAMILTLAPTALAAGEYTVSVSATPAANASDGTSYLVGTEVTLSAAVTAGRDEADGQLTYLWSDGTTGSTTTVTANTPGTVSVTCDVSATKTIPAEGENGQPTTETKSGRGSIEIVFVAAPKDPSVATELELGTPNPTHLTAGSSDTATVTATVLDQYGDPMAGQAVTATLVGNSTASDAGVEVSGLTGSDGKATITVSPGSAVGKATFLVSAGVGTGLNRTFEVSVDANTPTIKLDPPSLEDIYYNGTTNSSATMKMTTTGDLTDYKLSWNVNYPDALAAGSLTTTVADSYTLTAGKVTSSTKVTIQAVLTKGSEKITSNTVSIMVYPSEVFTLTTNPATNTVINWNTLTTVVGGYQTFSVTPKWISKGSEVKINTKNASYKWVLNGQTLSNETSAVTLSASDLSYGQNNILTCTVTFKYESDGTTAETKTATWTISMGYSSTVLATATVSTSTSSYALGDVDDAGKISIADQLENYFYNTTRNYYGLVSVRFSNVKDGSNGSLNATAGTDYYATQQGGANARYLADVLFYPGTTKTTATFQATFYYYNTRNPKYQSDISSVTGAITFSVVESASAGDITYTAAIGDDVAFSVKDFEDFYYSKTRGTLSYVSFTMPTGGTLYADGGRLNTSNTCYVSPTRTQTDLAGVYFSPTGTTATRAGSVRISFTAYGTRGTGTSGTVAITYLSGTAKDITYNITTSGTLKASDFTNAYREVVGSTAPTGLTIEFQNVPTYGTLTYKDSSRTSATTVSLRDSNIKTYKFTTRTTGSNQLGDVTYTANGSHTDTIDYIAYVNNTPQFTGKVVFNSTNASASNMQVGYTSTNGQAVTFSYAEFAKANATVIAGTSYIRFVTMPTGGTLSYNGTAMTLSSPNVAPASLGSVVYRPSTGFNNSTDRISFLCYDANGNSVGGGQVSIVVTGNGNSAAVATVNSFKDVSSTAWYRTDLITLVGAGIIQGRGDGKFDPTAELTYGEALKIFMLASGYPKQAEASGKDWAINYKNLAVSNGWIGSDVDLSAKISRNAMAELAAKSLGVAANSTVPPTWTDGTSNGYSNALYYTNPQILIGNADGTFKGNDTLKRQEICAIACRVMNYRTNQQDQVKPDGI